MAQSMVVQKSKTVKNDVNVKKDSLAFTQKGEKYEIINVNLLHAKRQI